MSIYLKKHLDNTTLDLIADFICGDDYQKFPEYRSSYYLTKFFSNLDVKKEHDGSSRKRWVAGVLRELSLDDLEKIILRLVSLKEYKADIEKLKQALGTMNNILMMDGLKIEFDKDVSKIVSIDQVDIDEMLGIKKGLENKDFEINKLNSKKYIGIDRKKYLNEFTKDNFYNYKCPKCETGYLEIDKKTFKQESTNESEKMYNETGEPAFLELLFYSTAVCNNSKCQEKIILCGKGRVEETFEHDEMGPVYKEHFLINYFNPPENIIDVSDNVPEKIKASLLESFLLFWVNTSSSGNKIRKALDVLMDEMEIEKGRLHSRINVFGGINNGKYKELSDMLMGVKWLGNFGSHEGGLRKEDLLDAYEVMDFILHEMFVKDNYLTNIKLKAKSLENKFKKK